MEKHDIDNFTEQLILAEAVRNEVRSLWNATAKYWDNTIFKSREYDPGKLVSPNVGTWGFDNAIPEAGRAFVAWVLSRPFEVKVTPMGDPGDIVLAQVANGLSKLLRFYKKQPEFNDLLRELAIRMKFFNYVGTCDYWCDLHDKPVIRIIPHDDLYCDPTASAMPNMPGGPRFVAIRKRLHEDEARNRYGAAKLKDMKTGILGDFDKTITSQGAYEKLYEVFDWYGIDETEINITRKETEEAVIGELQSMMETGQPQIDADLDHEMAMEIGDKQMMDRAKEVIGSGFITVEEAMSALATAGYAQPVQMYMGWRQMHADALAENEESGTRPKYKGYIYHAEFQYGSSKMLLDPEELDYNHYEIPISIYRSHLGTQPGLCAPGPAAEFLPIQVDVEYYERCERELMRFQSRPSFQIDRDVLDPEMYPNQKGVLSKLVQNIRDGMAVVWTRGSQGKDVVKFNNVGNVAYDIRRVVDYKRYRIQQIIGPTAEMRGDVSGEVSGKAYVARQQSAGVPISDTLGLLESGIQKAFNRMAVNIVQYAPIEHMAQIAGPQHAQALKALRDSGMDARFAVQVILGNYFPTDHQYLINFETQMGTLGVADWEEIGESLGSPIKLHNPMMPGAAPGQVPPGAASPPSPVPIQGTQ